MGPGIPWLGGNPLVPCIPLVNPVCAWPKVLVWEERPVWELKAVPVEPPPMALNPGNDPVPVERADPDGILPACVPSVLLLDPGSPVFTGCIPEFIAESVPEVCPVPKFCVGNENKSKSLTPVLGL